MICRAHFFLAKLAGNYHASAHNQFMIETRTTIAPTSQSLPRPSRPVDYRESNFPALFSVQSALNSFAISIFSRKSCLNLVKFMRFCATKQPKITPWQATNEAAHSRPFVPVLPSFSFPRFHGPCLKVCDVCIRYGRGMEKV